MKNVDEFLQEELNLSNREIDDGKLIDISVTEIRSLLLNWTAQMVINDEYTEE